MAIKASILIVEDSFIVAFHLKTTLESEGYEVIATQDSGESALELLKTKQPDLVLMDIMLNGELDGVETARIIRSEYDLPIIYITALTDKSTIQRAKITAPYGYLTKPFEDREIFTVIEMALYKHGIESKLKTSEEKYFSTVRSISDAVILIDEKFDITYLNPSAEALSGYLLSESLGKLFFDIFKFQNSETGEFPINPIQCEIPSKLGGHTLPSDLTLLNKSGIYRPIGEGSLSPILDNKGRLTGFVIIFKDVTEKLAHEKLKKNFEKERLGALLEGQEKERSRIARDLHDGLGQMLTAIRMNIGLLVKDEDAVAELFRLLDDAVQESVRISENLLPSKLKDFDLSTCLNSLCNQVRKTTRIQIDYQELGEVLDIDQTQKINIFRIAQEAINNAIKHASATNINVQLNADDDRIVMLVEDNGIGIDAKRCENRNHSAHHGLVNMRERAEIMEGKLIIESDKDRGTLIILEVPVNHKFAKV